MALKESPVPREVEVGFKAEKRYIRGYHILEPRTRMKSAERQRLEDVWSSTPSSSISQEIR